MASKPIAPRAIASPTAAVTSLILNASFKRDVAVAMIGMPKAAQVECALTRRAGLPAPAHGSPAININLNDKTAVTIVRTSVAVGSDKLVWRAKNQTLPEPDNSM